MNPQTAIQVASLIHKWAKKQLQTLPPLEEPAFPDLFGAAHPNLEKGLGVYDLQQSPGTPVDCRFPGKTTKQSCQKDLEKILDALLRGLGTCGAERYRQHIREVQDGISASKARIAQFRERLVSANDREALNRSIAEEEKAVAEGEQRLKNLTDGFHKHLQNIGISVSRETAGLFLLPVEDDILSMAAVVSNMTAIANQLERLTDDSREAPAETRRYYGMYLLLVMAVDRIQTHFIDDIDATFLPKAADYYVCAKQNIAEAERQLSRGGPADTLRASIAANRRTMEACDQMRAMLLAQQAEIRRNNLEVRKQRDAAAVTYRTICLGLSVAETLGSCQAAFQALRELRLPALRPFENVQLNDELQRLAERVALRKT